MAIHWYPGHMHKARKDIIEAMPNIDLVIEVLDARIPFSSENPVIAQVRRHKGNTKPCLKVLSKTDLADPVLTQVWSQFFEQENHTKVLPIAIREENIEQRLLSCAREFFPDRAEHKAIRVMVMGIPNVGKSSLINRLAGRTIAKVGNEPAITKRQQRIDIGDGFILNDTPGILWPKVENIHSSYRLAASGAIKETAMDYVDVAFYVADYLLANYGELLLERYQLSDLPESAQVFFELVGAKRGCLRNGGQVDLNKICTLFINEFRSGQVGRITLETPEMIDQELKELKRLQEEKEKKNLERKRNFRSSKN
ncbi:MAG TPA: ribosome biogenesis GTPase YlqF [Pseudomonadales bacterium]|nr:ribosome biogenesis GTPase YlqF [Pseudomonadales bacterium]